MAVSGPINLVQGQSSNGLATVSRVAFTGPVRLSLSDLPPGLTGKFDPATLSEGVSNSTLTLEAALTAAVGSATVTVTASATGVSTATASTTVSISEAPGFGMIVAPNSLTIERGGNGVATISFQRRGGFSGPITLSVGGLPAGVVASFADPAPAGVSTTVTLAVDKAVALGSYPLVITGQGAPGTRVADLILNVAAAQPVPSFSLSVSPASLAMAAGSNGQATVAIARDGGFSGPVSLAVEGQPAGVTASFDNASPTGDQAVLTLTSLSSTAPGGYNFLVRGTASGLADQTASLTLTIVAASGGFTVSVAPASLEVQTGQSRNATVTVLKIGAFSGTVTLSATNVPSGVTVSFNPTTASAPLDRSVELSSTTSAVMTVAVAAGVASGNYPFQVVGKSAGQPDQTTAFLLVVNPPPGTGNTTFSFCGAGQPIWFASRNGSDPWIRVIGVQSSGGSSFSFDIGAGEGGAAFVRGSELDGFTVTVLQGTRADLQQFGGAQCSPSPGGNKTLTGSIAGVGPDDQVMIALGRTSEAASAAAPGFTLKRVQTGPVDLMAVQSALTASGPPFRSVPLSFILRPGTDYPDNTAIPVLNFSTEGFAPATANLTIGNLGGDLATLLLSYQSPTTTTTLQYGVDETGSSQVLYGLPLARQPAGGLHTVNLFATPSGAADGRTWVAWFRTMANRSVTLAEPLAIPSLNRLGGSYPRFEATGPLQPSYQSLVSLELRQDLSDGSYRSWALQSSGGLFPGGSFRLGMPDFRPVAGWSEAWVLQGGVTAQWVVTGTGMSGPGVLPSETDGSTLQTATRSGLVLP